MITSVRVNQSIDVTLTNEDVAELSTQPCCDSVDLVDRILSTYTWHDSRSLEGKIKIIKMLQKHIDIVLSTIPEKERKDGIER
jgi:hypothetical protein